MAAADGKSGTGSGSGTGSRTGVTGGSSSSRSSGVSAKGGRGRAGLSKLRGSSGDGDSEAASQPPVSKMPAL